MRSFFLFLAACAALFAIPSPTLAADQSLADKYLQDGKLPEGIKALQARLQNDPHNDELRFGLGTLQFFRAVEHLGQSLHRYGVMSKRGERLPVPFLRLPVPENPKPETITYEKSRKIFEDVIADLKEAEGTLAKIKDEKVKLTLNVGKVRFDFDSNGKGDDPIHEILKRYFGGRRAVAVEDEAPATPAPVPVAPEDQPKQPQDKPKGEADEKPAPPPPPQPESAPSRRSEMPDFEDLQVTFDRGDVPWLRGYCHLLIAFAEVSLAHDGQELFDATAHLFYARPETPFKFLEEGDARFKELNFEGINPLDVVALVHLIRLPVKEPKRMESALGHLQQMLALSRESWKFIQAEEDDDQEWIPNAKQKGALSVDVTQEMIDSWLEFADEGEALLAGKRLVPFWRGDKENRGINLRKVFMEPDDLDLVLWVQGTAAAPYLEEGTLTKKEVWQRMQEVFRGNFVGFAVWFN